MTRPPNIAALLDTYPRPRPPLTQAHEAIFAQQYRINRDGSGAVEGLAQRLERWMHARVARQPGGPILELGAGTLNHLQFEPPGETYDVVEPFHELYRGRPEAARIRSFYDSVGEVPPDRSYHRIVSVAVLEHLTDLPREVAGAALHLRPGGIFQAGIPSEGGFLWGIGWRFSTGISYRLRTGLDYGIVMRHEHVNRAPEILAVVRHLFERVAVRRFPFQGHHASFYTY
ncbi:MAG TPA: methyltransferase domain-containing protein, partial [Casimicrobiaceae bacterium]|nr:methyltransferase domain-containing protein [Casimicrobiaceae bacterium]